MDPMREQALTCVECGGALVARASDGRHWARCDACGGVWMETAQFLSLLREAVPDKAVDELMVHNDGSPRHPCPVCAESMDLAWLDFLCVDQCERHGVWFERGELEKALRWQVGGEVVGQAPAPTSSQHLVLIALIAR